jgi:uncharacterized UPF0160 family protein
MEVVDLLNKMRERLPVYRSSGKSYKETLKDELDEYNNLLEQIDEKELKQYSELTKRRFINFSNKIKVYHLEAGETKQEEKSYACRFDKVKHDADKHLTAYLYLKNKRFIKAHLLKAGLANMDENLKVKHKNKFLEIYGK